MAGSKTFFPKLFSLALLISGFISIGSTLSVTNAATALKIMPVGDSCTAGVGDPNMGSYRTDLYKLYTNAGLSIDFVGSQKGGPNTLPDRDNEGHSGWMIPQIASNIDNWLKTYNPDVVLLWIGGNDVILGGKINTTGLSNLIDQILTTKPNVKIFVADYYPVPDKIKEYNVTIPGVVQAKANAGKKVYFVKLSDIDYVKSTDLSSDGLHLNPNGYSKIAKIWYKSTISILNPTTTTSPTPSPSKSPSPTPSVQPSPSATIPGSYAVAYTVNDWGSGATVSVTIKNNSATAVNGWTLDWTFPGNQKIGNMWNATYTQSGTTVAVKNQSYNSSLPAGASITFGFNLSYSGSNAKPTSFKLNGADCTLIN